MYILLIILFIVITLCLATSYKSIDHFANSTGVSNFVHQLPKERYPDLIKEFGYPTYIVNRPNGVAIWKDKDFYTKIMLKDESIQHNKPKPHCDFLYSTINVYIPFSILMDVLRLSESIFYDQLKKELTARCHFMGANVATLYLAMMITNDPSNAQKYRSMYGDTIMSTMEPENYKKLERLLKTMVIDNQIKFRNEMPNKNCMIRP